jgi:hypothetical protein
MRILFDHVTPRGIARFLASHTVTKAKDRGWDTLTNGDLLAEAERAGFEVLLTADKNMRYQQNLYGPAHSPCGVEHAAMAAGSLAPRHHCRCRECRYARQLCRGDHPLRVKLSCFTNGKLCNATKQADFVLSSVAGRSQHLCFERWMLNADEAFRCLRRASAKLENSNGRFFNICGGAQLIFLVRKSNRNPVAALTSCATASNSSDAAMQLSRRRSFSSQCICSQFYVAGSNRATRRGTFHKTVVFETGINGSILKFVGVQSLTEQRFRRESPRSVMGTSS